MNKSVTDDNVNNIRLIIKRKEVVVKYCYTYLLIEHMHKDSTLAKCRHEQHHHIISSAKIILFTSLSNDLSLLVAFIEK